MRHLRDVFLDFFEGLVAFLVRTFSQTGRLLKRPVVACSKPPWAFMNGLTCGSCDLQTCGETDRVESSRFCKPSCAFVEDFTFGSCVLASFRSDRHLRIRVESKHIDLNRPKTCYKIVCPFMAPLPVLGNSYFSFLLILRYLCQLF